MLTLGGVVRVRALEGGGANIVGPGVGGRGTEIRDFIFLEGWFHAGVLWGQTLEMIIL